MSCVVKDDMICLSCTASITGREGHSNGERVCLAAEGFGNRTCFLQSMANKVCVRHFVLTLLHSIASDTLEGLGEIYSQYDPFLSFLFVIVIKLSDGCSSLHSFLH